MKSIIRALTAFLVAVCVVVAGLALPPITVLSSPDDVAETWLHYDIDYSQVPSWVRVRNLTLKVSVGQAQDVEIVADGRTISSSYDSSGGWVTFTTNAATVDVRLVGLSTPIGQIGVVQKAALRDDKRWAYSLTFDDGYTDVWVYGKPMLDRLGYRASVAVIGEWLGTNAAGDNGDCAGYLGNGQDDALANGWMDANYLRALASAGWGLFNHGYVHNTPEAMPGCILQNMIACTEALSRAIPGYRTLVYTAYQNRTDLADLAVGNQPLLGFALVQAGGGGATQINSIQWGTPFRLQRFDVGAPRERLPNTSGAIYYMDEAHEKVVNNPTTNYWLSLHGHHVQANDVAGSSLDYLHFTYGPGGTDEAWVAPADEVLQYLATRDFAIVRQIAFRAVSVAYRSSQIRTAVFRQGWNGYAGTSDTYIDANAPTTNFDTSGDAATLKLRTPDKQAVLFKFDMGSAIPANARVLRATLGMYVLNHSNEGEIVASAYALRKSWDPKTVTWERASTPVLWAARGANGTTGDNRDRDLSDTDTRSLRLYKYKDYLTGDETVVDNQTWYSLDVTEAARDWVARPDTNFGVVLKASGGSADVTIVASEWRDSEKARRPCLVVTYMDPETAPVSTEAATATPPAGLVSDMIPAFTPEPGRKYTLTFPAPPMNPQPVEPR